MLLLFCIGIVVGETGKKYKHSILIMYESVFYGALIYIPQMSNSQSGRFRTTVFLGKILSTNSTARYILFNILCVNYRGVVKQTPWDDQGKNGHRCITTERTRSITECSRTYALVLLTVRVNYLYAVKVNCKHQ